MNLGQVLAELRNEKQVCQKEVAIRLNVSVSTISHYEKGLYNPDPETLCELADYYQVPTDYIFQRTTFRYDINRLNEKIINGYTAADFVKFVLEFDQQDRNRVLQYIELLRERAQDRKEKKTN